MLGLMTDTGLEVMMNKKSPTKKDYEKIISIQESIIKLKENEFKIIERVFDRVQDGSDNWQQWAFWYRAWSEYLESTIQKYLKTKKRKTFDNYKKVLSNPKVMDKAFPPLKPNCFDMNGGANDK